MAGKALARAEARWKAAENAEKLIQREKQARSELRREREYMISLLMPLMIIGCALWLALLSFSNVRERRNEIGLCRALGMKTSKLLSLFLLRALSAGLSGAIAGLILVISVFVFYQGVEFPILFSKSYIPLRQWLLIPPVTALVAVIACWLPALFAAQIDPAEILREE